MASKPQITATGPKDAGFSVLEALVAMTLLAMTLLPLLSLQMQFVRTAESLERTQQSISKTNMARARLSTINFSQTPTGEENFGPWTLYWTSKVYLGPKPVSKTTMRIHTSLYEVTATLQNVDTERSFKKFTVWGVGWEPQSSFISSVF